MKLGLERFGVPPSLKHKLSSVHKAGKLEQFA